MKKNDWILFVSAIGYSYLFYHAGSGINFLIFTLLLIVSLIIRNKKIIKDKKWLLATSGSLITAFCIFYYGNSLSLIGNIISLMLLSALSYSPETSVFTSLFFSAYSIAGSCIFVILDTIERAQKRVYVASERSGFIKFMLYILPIGILILFFLLYKGSNPVFDNFTNKINLDFISPAWILFTIGGVLLIYGFYYHKTISAIELKDKSAPDSIFSKSLDNNSWLSRNLTIENEVLSGIVLLSMLNILLLIVNGLDLNYLWLNKELPEGLTYSSFVHQGTGLLIDSIIIAILIIMFYFRGSVNIYHKNKVIKLLAFLWIIQNAFMIISTAARNDLYINEYSLTYKRIGVYVWLLLAFIGLAVTFIKILKSKTNWFLFRANSWIFYGVLVISCFIDWGQLVADFNIERAERNKKKLDRSYLLTLSDNVLPKFLVLNDSIKDTVIDTESGFFSSWDRGYYNVINFNAEVSEKLYLFLKRMHSKDWRSFNVSDVKVYRKVLQLNKDNKIVKLTFNNRYNTSLNFISELNNLRSLQLANTDFKNLLVLKTFKKLENLDISGNQIKDISILPLNQSLRELNIADNKIGSITALSSLINLERLDISGNEIRNFSPLIRLKKLKYLKIGRITSIGLLTLQNVLPGVNIDAVIINP